MDNVIQFPTSRDPRHLSRKMENPVKKFWRKLVCYYKATFFLIREVGSYIDSRAEWFDDSFQDEIYAAQGGPRPLP